VALKSDSDDHIRRLNQEAGKMIHYGGATEDEAIRMVTLNAAWIIGVDDRTGSIDVGKDADLVLWNHDPLSTYARAQKVYIDGDLFFDASLPGLGTTHFNGVMHDSGGFGSDDEMEDGQ
jgi:imidazolonepropionase-like amidohydrolase